MRWPDDATDWPLATQSRFVLNRPHKWHIQQSGSGPTVLLIHGAGGATQSWRRLFPLLSDRYTVIAVDLPGQGFTQLGARQRCGLDPMAEDLMSLCRAENWQPTALIGHSAGAAIALRMAEMMHPAPRVIGINAALGNFKGVAGWLFPALAKILAMTPFTAELFAATSSSAKQVAKLIKGTGSQIDATGLGLYQRLASDRDHVDATLAMMAQWSLDDLLSRLPKMHARCLLITGDRDLAVPPSTSEKAVAALPNGQHLALSNLGHLAHEEDPARVAAAITEFLSRD